MVLLAKAQGAMHLEEYGILSCILRALRAAFA
jgi:hypothetical protein